MLIPLWLPWAVVVALVLPFFLNVLKYEVPPPPGQERSGRSRYPRPAPGLGEAWGEGALVVALVVAVALTFDRVHVSDEELYDAVELSAASINGTAGTQVTDRVEVLVHDRLGRAVDLEALESDSTDESDTSTDYEVRLEDHDDGPVSCLELLPVGVTGEVEYSSLSAYEGPCGE